jgi:hypothetical protein
MSVMATVMKWSASMLEDLYIELPNENIRKEVLNNWESVLLPGEDFGILSGLTADYLMMTMYLRMRTGR